jgi:hypothetical protein
MREGRVRRYGLAYGDTALIARSLDAGVLVASLRSDLERAVAERARTRVFVHAGVVGWQGGAILIPGPAGSGKTCLVQALVGGGATYYSDEYAVLDHRGLVHPFARPLAPRGAGGRSTADAPIAGQTALPVRQVVYTRFTAGSEWRPRSLTPAATLMALLRNTVAVRSDPDRALRVLRAAVATVSGQESARGDAAAAARALLAA